jgi:hypothetical protein
MNFSSFRPFASTNFKWRIILPISKTQSFAFNKNWIRSVLFEPLIQASACQFADLTELQKQFGIKAWRQFDLFLKSNEKTIYFIDLKLRDKN